MSRDDSDHSPSTSGEVAELLLADDSVHGLLPITPHRATRQSFVIQSNALSRGAYERRLDTHAVRLVAVAISKIDQGADMLGTVTVTTGELRDIFDVYRGTNSFGAGIRAGAEALIGLKARIINSERDYSLISLVSRVDVRHGAVMVSFDPQARPIFLRLSSQYTRYQLSSISSLPTSYSILLYQYLRSCAHRSHARIPIEQLRLSLGLEPDEHIEPHRFIARVIKPSVDAINLSSDLTVSYQPFKEGRNVIALDFAISISERTPLNAFELAAVDLLVEEGMARSSAIRSIKQHGTASAVRAVAIVQNRRANPAAPKVNDTPAYIATLMAAQAHIDPEDKKLMQPLGVLQAKFRDLAFEHLTPPEKDAHMDAFLSDMADRKPDLVRWVPVECRLRPASESTSQAASSAPGRTPEARLRAFNSHPQLARLWKGYLAHFLNPDRVAMELSASGIDTRPVREREPGRVIEHRPAAKKAVAKKTAKKAA